MSEAPIKPKAQACMIWLHGLGSKSADMQLLAQALPLPSGLFEHIFLDAPVRPVTINGNMRMQAWYDIMGIGFSAPEDRHGIQQAQQQVLAAVEQCIAAGYRTEQIILAGFSQGAAVALYTALHYPKRLAGVVVLSSYLPLAAESRAEMPKDTPIFMAYGSLDSVVLPMFSQYSATWLKQHHYKVDLREYIMAHEVSREEASDLSRWLQALLEGK